MVKRLSVLLALVCGIALTSGNAAADRIKLIRDAEIENTIRAWSAPLFEAAGLAPDSVRIHLVKDPALNAFVAGGLNLFINTGLLMRSEHAGQVIGVIAHETGHIMGGHLSRTHEAMRNSTAQAILGYVLGGAAMVAGRPDVGAAIMQGGQGVGMRSFLAYSRGQESAADQAAVRLLDQTGLSSRGLMEFMATLEDQELLSPAQQDPYLRTHPITRERVDFLRNHVQTSRLTGEGVPPEYAEMHRRMKAKLLAFLEPPSRTLRRYPESDTSLEARYARAIAYYRKPDLDTALPLVDALIAERPQDPFFRELKGQILFENGRIRESIDPYIAAVERLPDEPQLHQALGHARIETGDPDQLPAAIDNLRMVVHHEPQNSFAWRQLAIAYGRNGDTAMGALALAEEAALQGRARDARFHAEKASRDLPRGSPGWLRAQDILAHLDVIKDRD